jgi:hypothetical protein
VEDLDIPYGGVVHQQHRQSLLEYQAFQTQSFTDSVDPVPGATDEDQSPTLPVCCERYYIQEGLEFVHTHVNVPGGLFVLDFLHKSRQLPVKGSST